MAGSYKPKGKPKSKGWHPPYRRDISKHDHVGHMRFMAEDCFCEECGQMWEWGEWGWKPLSNARSR